MPARTLKKRRAAVSSWYERHKAERAAYMRKYRRRKRAESRNQGAKAPPA